VLGIIQAKSGKTICFMYDYAIFYSDSRNKGVMIMFTDPVLVQYSILIFAACLVVSIGMIKYFER